VNSRRLVALSCIAVLMRTASCIALALAATASNAEIYSCAGPRSMTVYQNFPCEFTSRGSVPASGSAQTKPSAPTTPGAATVARNATAGNTRTPPAVQTTVAPNTGPRPGMSEDDVRKAWGEPEEIIQDEPPSGRVDIWRYKDGRSVQINRRHRVVAVQL
jgi:hypothetical protein